MKATLQHLSWVLLCVVAGPSVAATRYVDLNSSNPTSPYTSWATAATNIQDAIDATSDGDLVLVTNGVYQAGGRTVGAGLLTNRVAMMKPITLQSVNGPESTTIQGYQVPGSGVGDSAIRCAYLTNGASLVGFTLTSGSTRTNSSSNNRNTGGGGLWCESTNAVISNCVIIANSAYSVGGGTYNGTLVGCSLIGNTSSSGGGARDSTLIRCVITANSATVAGGGVSGGPNFAKLYDCFLSDNSAAMSGGADRCILSGCLVVSNRSTAFGATGGGVGTSSALTNCVLIGNSAYSGGAASSSTLVNCLVVSNTAVGNGGGLNNSVVRNCTIVGNSALSGGGGGVFQGSIRNSIVYYNTAATTNINYSSVTELIYSCTIPNAAGVGNLTNEPAFVDRQNGNIHLQTNSPCINAANNSYVVTTADLDGRLRIVGGVADIGAYELQSSNVNALITWLSGYGLPTHALSDSADPDGDAMDNYGEWRSDTIPTNALSVLRMVSATNGEAGANITWQSVASRNYRLERSTNFAIVPSFHVLFTNIPGVSGPKTFTDITATNGGVFFYRVGVE